MELATVSACSQYLSARLVRTECEGLTELLSMDPRILAELRVIELDGSGHDSLGIVTRYLTPRSVANTFNLRWAVKDDDVDLLNGLLEGVTSTSAVGSVSYVLGGVPIGPAAAVAAISSAFVFFRRLKKKIARLTLLQYELLRAMKSSSAGMLLDELEGWLAWTVQEASRSDIETTLVELTAFRLADGTIAQLVGQDASGRWSAASI